MDEVQKSNLAAEAFRRHYSALHDALALPDVASRLATKLYGGAIITPETRDAVQTTGITPAQQASWLLQAVESSVRIDYRRLRKFVRVLKKQPVLSPIAKQLRQCYRDLVSEARLTESSSSGSDTDSTEQHQAATPSNGSDPGPEIPFSSHKHTPPFPNLTPEEQQEVLSAHHPKIRNFLNLDQIFPYLIQNKLLTDTEREELLSSLIYNRKQKITRLVSWLPKKGSDGLQRFVFCLRSSVVEGTAHQELADILQKAAQEVAAKRGDTKTGHTSFLKRTWIKILVVGLLAMLILWLYKSHYLDQTYYEFQYQFRLQHYSTSLPYLPQTFVGREVEVREMMALLDFSDTHNRIISINGPPGFGKSTLAIHVGHKMVREGVTVHYVDMMEVSSMRSLAEKVLSSDSNIVAIRNITVERLLKWARKQHDRTLLILDNCDDILHRQKEALQGIVKKLTQFSQNLKIILTSRWKTYTQFNQFPYTLQELSTVASCTLLQNTVTSGINRTSCDAITNLTGNVPLALQVVGALLNIQDPAPDLNTNLDPALDSNTVLESLEQKLIPTLSSDRFPVEERVNASISLSYEYLTPRLRKIGRYLAHFPSSFDQEAACKILLRIAKNPLTCSDVIDFLDHLLERSLLEYNRRVRRYHYHRLIREFFLDIEKSTGDAGENETRRFLRSFQSHYADRLLNLLDLFKTSHVKALAKLDTEQHNILHLVRCTATLNPLVKKSDYLHVVGAIHMALDRGYLTTRLAAKELLGPVKGIVSYLNQKLLSLLSKKYVPSNTCIHTYSQLHVHYILYLARLEEQIHGVSTAVETFHRRKYIIELMAFKLEGQEITSSYILFYRKLSQYYAKLEQHDEEKQCHIQILRKLNKKVDDYERGTCQHLAIGRAYYAAADYENSARSLQLALQLETEYMDAMEKANLMLLLHESYKYIHNSIKADRVLETLIALFPSVMDAPMSEVYGYSATVREYIEFLKSNDKDEEATALEDKLIEATLEIGAKLSDVSTTNKIMKLAKHLYEQNKCKKAADLAVFALESFTPFQHDGAQELVTLQLQLLIGKAKFCAGNYSEGLNYIELMVDSIYEVEEYEHYLLTEACPYMILRCRLWCLIGTKPQNILYVGGKMIIWIYKILKFNDNVYQPESALKTQAQVTQLSHSKELAVTTGQIMKIQLLLDISHSFSQLYSHLSSLLYSYLSSVVSAVLVTIQWIISFKIVQCLINVAFIFEKQLFSYLIIHVSAYIILNSAMFGIHTISNFVTKLYIIILLAFCNVDIHVRDAACTCRS